MAVQTRQRPAPAAIAIAAMFFVNGMTFSSWLPRLPEIRDELGVGDAALGLTLVGAGTGGLLMSALSGRLVDRIGSRTATISTSVALSILLPFVAFTASPWLLFAALVAIGGVDGLTDVAMNTQAMQFQQSRSRSIMNRMHGTWSIGALAGGVIASRAAAVEVSLRVQLLVTAAVLVVVTVTAGRRLLPGAVHHGQSGPQASRPMSRRHMIVLFVVGIAAILAELPLSDWASLLVAERFDVRPGIAALGYVAVAAGMVAGRFGGDLAVDRFGAEHARRGGAVLAFAGVVVVSLSPVSAVAFAGLLIGGVGVSTLFPMAVRRATELAAGSSAGLATFSTGARFGILLSSPLMGSVSQASTRTIALATIAGAATLASALVRLPSATPPP